MTDMELVIKIPEEEYRNICLMSKEGIGMALYDWVANGIQLPKGHGKIIDESQITKCYMPINSFDMRGIRTNAPAIIEADKESDIE